MYNVKKILIALFLVFLTITPTRAENVIIKKGDTLTLKDCIDIAISKNPNITLGNNITKVYKSRIGQAKSSYLPQVNVSTGYNRQNPITNASIDKNNNNYSGTIGLNQLIYDFGKTPLKSKIQDLYLNSSKVDVEDAIIQVTYNVKQSYYSALSAKISKDIYYQSIQNNELHLKQANAFFQFGKKSKIDVTTAEVNLSNAKLNYIKSNNAYKTAIASLNNVMGIPKAPDYDIVDTLTFKHIINNQNKEVEIAYKESKNVKKTDVFKNQAVLKTAVSKNSIIDNLIFEKYNISLEDAIKTAYTNRPDLKSLVIKGSAANESIKLVKKDYFPSMSGFASYGTGGQAFPLDNGWSLGANFSMPMFNGYLTKNQVNEAKANLDVAKSNIEILKQNIYLQVQQSYINLIEAEKRIPVSNLIVKQAKENLDLANGRYKVGVGNSMEVQDAEINYNNAQLSYVQALYDYNVSRSTLEKAMGVK